MLQHDGRVLKQMWLLWCCSCTSFQCGLQFNSSLVCPSADPSIYRLFSVIRWCNVCICMQYALSTYVSIHLQPCRCRVLVVFYFFATSGTSVATLQKTLRVSWEGQQKVLARPHWNLFSKGCPYCSFGASRSRGAGSRTDGGNAAGVGRKCNSQSTYRQIWSLILQLCFEENWYRYYYNILQLLPQKCPWCCGFCRGWLRLWTWELAWQALVTLAASFARSRNHLRWCEVTSRKV